MKALFLFLSSLLLIPQARAADDPDICHFYVQKSHDLGCTVSNYLESFGDYYCRTFLQHENEFTPEGRLVFENIRHCLIDAIKNKPGLTCANVREFAEDSHVSCYKASGFCGIKLRDKLVVLKYSWRELVDTNFWKVVSRVNQSCKEKN